MANNQNSAYQVDGRDFQGACYRPNRVLQDVNGRLSALETTVAPGAATVQIAQASAALTLSNALSPIPGAAVFPSTTGTYLVTGCFDFIVNGDAGQLFTGALLVGTAEQKALATYQSASSGDRATVVQQWLVTISALTQSLSLRASKAGGAGTSTADLNMTIITVRIGP